MAKDVQLSDLQLAIMRVLWDRGEASAAEVHEQLLPSRELAPTTVATVLSRLEKRSLVAHRTQGRQYIYSACIDESLVRRSMVARLTDFFFGGDQAALVSHLVEDQQIGEHELAALKQLIAARESDRSDDG